MSFIINEKCTGCKKCQTICPVSAIIGKEILKIDPKFCINCSLCLTVCKYDAITNSSFLSNNEKRV